MYEFAVCTSSEGDNESWHFMSKLAQFTGRHFLNSIFYGNLNNIKLDLNVSTRVKFGANDQGLWFKKSG